MGIARPKSVDSRGAERGGGGGGGGGGGAQNPWTSFQDITDPNGGGWTVRDGSGVNSDTSLAMDGDVLVFNQASPSNLRINRDVMNGKVMIRSNHLKMVEDAGMVQPSGVAAHLLQPEAALLKVEVVFDTDNGGPINGVSSPGGWGNDMTCIVGFVGYKTDQGGNPGIPGAANQTIWQGAQVRKNGGANPATSTSTSLYQSGYKTYFTDAVVNGYTWKNMQNPPAAAHDSLVYVFAPMRKGPASGASTAFSFAGSYAKDQPWNPWAFHGSSVNQTINFWNAAGGAQTYWHLAVWFGSGDSSVTGNIRIKKINYLLQPLVGRTSIT